jgi:hypothetical protein
MSKSIRVSTVENLVKPIADPSVPFVRTVINGYFQTITNLYNVTIAVRWLIVCPRPDIAGLAPGETINDRTYTTSAFLAPANHTIIWDITGGNSFGQTDVGELLYIGKSDCSFFYLTNAYKLCRGWTAQLAVLPFLGNPNTLLNPKLEIRSHISLAIVGIGANISTGQVQVPVMLSAEQRGTFVPYNNPFTTNVAEVSQLDTSLTLGSGRAENNILWTATPNTVPPNVSTFATSNGVVTPSELEPFVDVISNLV